MVRARQTRRAGKLEARSAGTASAREPKGDTPFDLRDRHKSDRARTPIVVRKSKRAKGIGKLTLFPIDSLEPDPRKHSRIQVRAIARSIEAFGFNAPILVDKHYQIVAGHERHEAAQLLGLKKVRIGKGCLETIVRTPRPTL